MSDIQEQIQDLGERLEIEDKRKKLKELDFEIADPDLWKNKREVAEEKTKEAGMLREVIEEFEAISSQRDIERLETKVILSGKYDSMNAILSLHAGAGGDDARDWAMMLLEMYQKYAQKRDWKLNKLSENTLEIKGSYAYGFLRNESGVHRLVRISPYDASKKRHTSFALVEVLPDIPKADAENIKIPEADIRFEFSRSSGPGGQNVNKVETAVRVVHIPTGVSASSEAGRSQAHNKEKALTVLKSKLFRLMEEKQAKEIGDLKTSVKVEWGSQIRSYVLHPYKMVKDHRTDVETSKVDEVLAGELDEFIDAEIKLNK